MLSKTSKGQAVVNDAVESIASGIIGLRLNNPFSIERGTAWQGLATEQKHARFATFNSMPYGIRAWHKLMQTYRNRYGLRTVKGIIDRFNPVADGQPSTYVPNVAKALGVSANSAIDVMNRDTAFKMARAMMAMEIGAAASLTISDADINKGLSLAGVS